MSCESFRLFAGDHPLVRPDDIVITADVNLFVINRRVLNFILNSPEKTAWVQRYDAVSAKKSKTFNQNLVAMKARTWLRITGYKGNLTEIGKISNS